MKLQKYCGETIENTKILVHRGKKELRKILLKKGFDEMNKVLKLFIIVALTTIMLTGITYASSILIDNIKNMLKSYEVEETVVNEPVSETEAPAGEIVYKTFNIMTNEKTIQLEEWQENDSEENKLYYKKVSDYLEYKELMERYSNLRTLKESDFENYFAVVIISPNVNKSLKYKYITYSEYGDDEMLHILMDYDNVEEENVQYSGLVVIMTNRHIDYIIKPEIID